MFRYRPTAFSAIRIIFLAALTLSLPFIHLHPPLTHAGSFGEHSHDGVIHTIFSSDSAGNPSSSADGLDFENSAELFRTAINLNLSPQRLPTETISNGMTAVWVSFVFFLSPIVIYTSLDRNNVLSLRSSWMGSLPSLRAPPFPSVA